MHEFQGNSLESKVKGEDDSSGRSLLGQGQERSTIARANARVYRRRLRGRRQTSLCREPLTTLTAVLLKRVLNIISAIDKRSFNCTEGQ